jgi:HEXXH motif-containing protein
MRYHQLTAEQLAALTAGSGSRSAIEELTASRVSHSLLLFKHLAEAWSGDRADLDAAVTLLARAQAADPQVHRRLFGYPMVDAWLTRAARTDVPPRSELLQVGSLAAAAAVRAGLDGETTGWATGGRVHLPTLGTATLDGAADGPVVIAVRDGEITMTGPSGTPVAVASKADWEPVRLLSARHEDLECSVFLEDLNPYRNGYHARPEGRLSDDEFAQWQDLFTDAWRLIARYRPESATEIAAGLHAVVPLIDTGDGSSRSGTARESVGAMAATKPASAEELAITLVHEFEHSKLCALIDLMPLYRAGGKELHYAPWRRDKRPTSGLIQGVFAFIRVADMWDRFRAIPGLTATATAQFAEVREQVRVGYESLARSGELTPAGEAFVAGLRPALTRLLAEPLPDTPQAEPLAKPTRTE